MPLQLNRRPLGVDDILGGKLWTQSQLAAADLLSIGYDATEAYLAARYESIIQNVPGGLAAAGSGGQISFGLGALTVPNDEAWFIHGYSVTITTAGASSVAWFRPMWLLNPQLTTFRLYGPDEHKAVNTTNGETGGITWFPNKWVPPGSFAGVAFGPVATGGGNPTCQGHAWVTRVRV